jgi:transcriptional regulator with XRE-family HTH domain
MSAFSDELARLMAASGTGVRALARMSGYSAGYLSRLRNGLQSPPGDTAARLDELLDADGALIAAARQHDAKPPRPDMTAAWRATPPESPAPREFPDGISPAEHLHRLRVVLMEQDNLLGPGHVAPVLLDQIRLIEQLRQGRDGTDARDLLLLQAMYSEFAAWCAQDAADWRTAQYWLDRALELAHMTLDPVWPAYILARKAQLAGDMHDPVHAVGLARAAAATARDGYQARLSAAAAVYQAQGHALGGDETACLAALETAHDQADNPDEDPSVPWAGWLGPLYVTVHEARCRAALGRHDQAAALYAGAIAGIPDRMCRDRGVYTARMALAQAGTGDIDAAAAAGLAALAVAQATSSGRIITELRRLDSAIVRHRTRGTAALHDALTAAIRQPRHT